MSVASKLITIAENLRAKLDAINVKLTAKGQTEAANFDEVPAKIEAIEMGSDVSGVTATADDVLSPKVFVDASGTEQTGTIVTKTSSDLTTSGATVAIPAGYYASDTSKSVTTAIQATPNINISPTGLITASATQSAGYVSSGTKDATKQLSTKSATTYTPSAINQIISSGYYLTGTQTIKGDRNLVAENIKSGVSIFGINGKFTGGILVSCLIDLEDTNTAGASTIKVVIPSNIVGNYVNKTLKAYDIIRYGAATIDSGFLCASWTPNFFALQHIDNRGGNGSAVDTELESEQHYFSRNELHIDLTLNDRCTMSYFFNSMSYVLLYFE